MAKKYNIHRISKRKTYTVKEIAVLLGVHVRTVQGWLSHGLKPVENSIPYLIQGEELAQFLNEKQCERRNKLALDEFYCVKCRQARKSLSGSTHTSITQKLMGGGKTLIVIKALCEVCGGKINRFNAIYTEHVTELLGTGVGLANTDIKEPKI